MDKIEKTEYEWKEKEVPELSFKPLKIIMGIGIVFSLLIVLDGGGIENKISTFIAMLIFFLILGVIISVINNWCTGEPSKYIGQCPYCKNEISFANGEQYIENDKTRFYIIQKEIPDIPIGVNCKFCKNRIIIKEKYFHPISSKVEVDKGMKKCLFCAELIKEEAIICRYCNREQE